MSAESRIDRRFAALRDEGRAGLVTFLSAGDPDYDSALDLLKGLPGAEGTLEHAPEKTDRTEIFNAAAKEAVVEKDRVAESRAKAAKKAAEERAEAKAEEKPAEDAPAEAKAEEKPAEDSAEKSDG